jgi:hypothetical protein
MFTDPQQEFLILLSLTMPVDPFILSAILALPRLAVSLYDSFRYPY